MPRKANHTTPKIQAGLVKQYSPFGYEQWLIDSHPQSWQRFLDVTDSFYYEGAVGCTVRKERRHGNAFWYAYKRQAGKLYKVYVGDTGAIFNNRKLLFEASQRLRDKLPH